MAGAGGGLGLAIGFLNTLNCIALRVRLTTNIHENIFQIWSAELTRSLKQLHEHPKAVPR